MTDKQKLALITKIISNVLGRGLRDGSRTYEDALLAVCAVLEFESEESDG